NVGSGPLERDVVVHVAVATAGGRYRATRHGAADAEIAARLIRETSARTSATAAVEHGEVGVEALQHDFGGVLLGARLVGPFARLQLALDVNLGALLQILLGDLGKPFREDHHAVPLGLFLALAGGLVAPLLRCRNAEIGDG